MAQAATAPESVAKKRTRSPAYPYVNLQTALAKAKQFYDAEQRNAANINVAAKHWGFVEGSSAGLQTVAALVSFGLMEDQGTGQKRTVQLTQNALRILLDTRPDAGERLELIKQAALAPKIHRQLWEKFQGKLPSDAQLRHTLIFEWKTPFNENSVDYFIGEFRSTIEFAKLSESDKMDSAEVNEGGEIEEEKPDDGSSQEVPPLGRRNNQPPKSHMQEFVVPLSEGSKAIFQWPSSLTREDVDDLKDSLRILERQLDRSGAKARDPEQNIE